MKCHCSYTIITAAYTLIAMRPEQLGRLARKPRLLLLEFFVEGCKDIFFKKSFPCSYCQVQAADSRVETPYEVLEISEGKGHPVTRHEDTEGE